MNLNKTVWKVLLLQMISTLELDAESISLQFKSDLTPYNIIQPVRILISDY
jgi:hypothetical protein